jgi:hypothetical protein
VRIPVDARGKAAAHRAQPAPALGLPPHEHGAHGQAAKRDRSQRGGAHASVREQLAEGGQETGARREHLFQRLAEGHGVSSAQPRHGASRASKASAPITAASSPPKPPVVGPRADEGPPRLADRLQHGLAVPGQQASAGRSPRSTALRGHPLRGLERPGHPDGIGHDRRVRPSRPPAPAQGSVYQPEGMRSRAERYRSLCSR